MFEREPIEIPNEMIKYPYWSGTLPPLAARGTCCGCTTGEFVDDSVVKHKLFIFYNSYVDHWNKLKRKPSIFYSKDRIQNAVVSTTYMTGRGVIRFYLWITDHDHCEVFVFLNKDLDVFGSLKTKLYTVEDIYAVTIHAKNEEAKKEAHRYLNKLPCSTLSCSYDLDVVAKG